MNAETIERIKSYYQVQMDSRAVAVGPIGGTASRLIKNCQVVLSFGQDVADLAEKGEDGRLTEDSKKALAAAGCVLTDNAELMAAFYPAEAREEQRRDEVLEAARQMICRAFGVLDYQQGGDGDNTAVTAAKNKGLDTRREVMNHPLGEGLYGHYICTAASIDSYADAFMITRGKRALGDLFNFHRAHFDIFFRVLERCNYDLHQPLFECWECGRQTSFWEITVDETLPAWEAMDQRLQFVEEYYCGC